MMVGDSGDHSTRRLREKTNRVIETNRRDERWSVDERAARALRALTGDEWTVFDNVRLPGRRFAHVDHVVVGPPGVFVIETKTWGGRISVANGVLHLDGRRRAAVAMEPAEAAFAVSQLLPEVAPTQVQGVLCFVGTVPIAGWSQSTLLCNTANVATMLASRPPVLDEAVRRHVVDRLEQHLSEEHASPRPVAGVRRSSVLRSLVAPLVGGVVALGLVAALLTHPDVFHKVGDLVVSIVDNGDAPHQPGDHHPKNRRSGRE